MNRRAIHKENDSIEIRSNKSDVDKDGHLLVGLSVADATTCEIRVH